MDSQTVRVLLRLDKDVDVDADEEEMVVMEWARVGLTWSVEVRGVVDVEKDILGGLVESGEVGRGWNGMYVWMDGWMDGMSELIELTESTELVTADL
jgi:hypothetical protein